VPAKGKGAVDFNHVSAMLCANRQKSSDFVAFYAARWSSTGAGSSRFVTFQYSFPQLIV
jgi:hypothetical protein